MHTSIGHQCCDQLTAVKTGYPLTSITWPYRLLRCWPIEVKYFFEVIRWQVTSFQMITGSSLIFFSFIWNMFCFWAAQLKFWFKTDLGLENSASYYRQDSCFRLCSLWSRVGHALHPFFMLWSKFDRLAHAENLCGILDLVYFDSWSCQSFVSTFDVFNCLFPLDTQNEIQLLSGVLCYSWLADFWLGN